MTNNSFLILNVAYLQMNTVPSTATLHSEQYGYSCYSFKQKQDSVINIELQQNALLLIRRELDETKANCCKCFHLFHQIFEHLNIFCSGSNFGRSQVLPEDLLQSFGST